MIDRHTPPPRSRPSTAVVEAVAKEQGVLESELPPLYDVVDPDALDALFKGCEEREGRVTFRYGGYQVFVGSDGDVVLDEPSEVV